MSNISALIDVFRMEEVAPKTRVSLIIKLGDAINYEFAGNITEPVVYELVKILDPENDVLKNERYVRLANESGC